ncbi:MAG: hypothetical protein HC853_08535 [Anaerolineae bacterium]|nr:hypothetical protein [Anaerolineae bacterium]
MKQTEPAKAQPHARTSTTRVLLMALLIAGMMLVASAGAGVWFLRKRGRRG